MSERKINTIMEDVRNLENSYDYERDYTDTMELVGDAYADYKNVLNYN